MGRVEAARRLVAEEEPRPPHDRAGDRDALALAAREGPRERAGPSEEPDPVEHLARLAASLGLRAAREEERQRDVLLGRQLRQQVVELEDEADASLRAAPRAAPGARVAQSAPSSATLPASGVSSPAKRWRSVDFPQPDGPVMARRSPARTRSDTSRKTSTRASPVPKPFARPSATRKGAISGATQRLHGGLPRGRAGRDGRGDERPEDRQGRDRDDVEGVDAERDVGSCRRAVRGKRDGPRRLEDERGRRPESDAERPSRRRRRRRPPRGRRVRHGPRRRAENREDGRVARARRREDGRRRREVQAGHDDDQEDGREEDDPLEPQREDEGAVLLLPRRHGDAGAERRGDRGRGPPRMPGSVRNTS